MWIVSELRVVTADYPSMEGDHRPPWRGHALVADGRTIAERIEFIAWELPRAGTSPCACCDPGCPSGGYIELRRTDRDVVWVPGSVDDVPSAFDAPPALYRCGTAVIEGALWDAVRAQVEPNLPAFASIAPLRWPDAWQIARFEAPRHLLDSRGEPPCIGSHPFVPPEELDQLAEMTAWGVDGDAVVELRPADGAEVITQYFEDNSEARLFARHEGAWALHLDSGHLLIPAR